MAFTDPPYNVDYEGYTKERLKIQGDRMSAEQFQQFLAAAFNNYHQIVKLGASLYICHSSSWQREFQNTLEAAGFEVRCQIIWAKNTFAWGFSRYKFQHEPIFYAHVAGQRDAWYGDKSQSTLFPRRCTASYDEAIFRKYASGYEKIIRDLKTALPDLRITVIEPSPHDDVTRAPNVDGGYNSVLVRYGQFVKDLAKREHLNEADLNSPVVTVLQKAHAQNATLSEQIVPDRVHPDPAGHLIMAEALLKSWHSPAVVSDVAIDAQTLKTLRSENAEVSAIDNPSHLRWTEREHALPMPIDWKDEVTVLAVRSSDLLDALDQEKLRVLGLAAGNYTLKIDGEKVGGFSADQLGQGVNLAEYPTPMAKQAAEVHKLTIEHNDIYFARWRMVEVPLDGQGFQLTSAESSLDALEKQVVLAQRVAAQPKVHQYELTRVQ